MKQTFNIKCYAIKYVPNWFNFILQIAFNAVIDANDGVYENVTWISGIFLMRPITVITMVSIYYD